MRFFAAALGLVLASSPARAQEAPPISDMVLQPPRASDAPAPPQVVNSHILFLNNCRPSGCTVTQGTTDSRTDHSDIGHGHINALSAGVDWNGIKACITTVMAPFNITVTDVDPGSQVDHFEVMIAGQSSNIGLPSSVGGIADYNCGALGQCGGTYISNALVFAFELNGNTTLLCGTAAQEIAHAWNLDHSTLSNDPMTYKNYTTPLAYRDNAPCGSDCLYTCPSGTGVCNSFGVTCSGSGQSGTHACMETGTATQNEIQIITALFGPAGAKPPVVAITAPAMGAAIQTGTTFPITATCTTTDGVQEIDLGIDGVQKTSVTTSPATFMGPPTLAEGSHHISVSCATKLQASATTSVDIVVGLLCSTDADCANNGICYQKTCIAGPDAPGGLGMTCTNNSDCKSGACANDGTSSQCVVPCDLNNDQCPAGFGCLDAGATGVCWLGADKSGGGCCDTRGDSRGSIVLGLGFAALLITRKRPNKRR